LSLLRKFSQCMEIHKAHLFVFGLHRSLRKRETLQSFPSYPLSIDSKDSRVASRRKGQSHKIIKRNQTIQSNQLASSAHGHSARLYTTRNLSEYINRRDRPATLWFECLDLHFETRGGGLDMIGERSDMTWRADNQGLYRQPS
jgi:hypothetical protein